MTRAEYLDAVDPDRAPHVVADLTPSLDELLIYVDADELAGVPAALAGVVISAREMAAAFAATRGARTS